MKTTKKLAVILVVALMLATMIALVACDPKEVALGEEGKGTSGAFTVVVLLPDGTPAVGCGVQLCEIDPETGEEGLCHPYYADEDGVAVLTQEVISKAGCTACNLHFPERVMLDGYKIPEKFAHLQIHIGKKITVQLEVA